MRTHARSQAVVSSILLEENIFYLNSCSPENYCWEPWIYRIDRPVYLDPAQTKSLSFDASFRQVIKTMPLSPSPYEFILQFSSNSSLIETAKDPILIENQRNCLKNISEERFIFNKLFVSQCNRIEQEKHLNGELLWSVKKVSLEKIPQGFGWIEARDY